MANDNINEIKKRIIEAENPFDALSEMIKCLKNIGDEYQNTMSNFYLEYGEKTLSLEHINEEHVLKNESVYGKLQNNLYYEYSDIIRKETNECFEKIEEIKKKQESDLKAIQKARTERIEIINDYLNGYDKARNIIDKLEPCVYIDFVKNPKKVAAECEEIRQSIPPKPDMSKTVSEIISEERRISGLINAYYEEEICKINTTSKTSCTEYRKEFELKIEDINIERNRNRTELIGKTQKSLQMLLEDEEILEKFDQYMKDRILFDDYNGEVNYKQLPETYDIGTIGLKVPDIFIEDELLRKSFKEISHIWSEKKIINSENIIRVPLSVPRKNGYSIVLPRLGTDKDEMDNVTSFALRNSMMFPVGKMEYVAICAKTTKIFAPLHSLKRQGVYLTGIGQNYSSEKSIQEIIENLKETVNSRDNRFFEKSNEREEKEHFITVLLYSYPEGINEIAKKHLSQMIDSAPENGINFIFFCDETDNINNSAFGKKTIIVKKNPSLFGKNSLYINYNKIDYMYDIGEVVSDKVWKSVIEQMTKHIGEAVDTKVVLNDLLPNMEDPNSYFNGGETTEGIVVPIAFMGTEPFEFVIGKRDQGDIRHFALIDGAPGSGKTELLHAIMLSIMYKYLPTEVQFCMMDYKEGVGINHFGNSPYIRSIVKQGDREAGRKELKAAVDEMNSRYDVFKSVKTEDECKIDSIYLYREKTGKIVPKIIIVIDELSGLTEKDDEISKECLNFIGEITQRGRAAGIHLILTSQTFDNTGISEAIKMLFVHRFSCNGNGKAKYNQMEIQNGKAVPKITKDLDIVFVNAYIDDFVRRVNKLLPGYISEEKLVSTQVVSSISSDHVENPLISFDIDMICRKPLHLYVGYAEDGNEDELLLNGSLLVVSKDKKSQRVGGISIMTHILLSIIQNRFASGIVTANNLLSMVAIEAEDSHINQIDKVRVVFPEYIQGIYARISDDDETYDENVDKVKTVIDNFYEEYEKRSQSNENNENEPKYLIIYGLHKLRPLKSSSTIDMNTGFVEKDSIAKVKELICKGAKQKIFIIAWVDENYENAATLFEEENIQKLFSIVIASGMGDKMSELVNYKGKNAEIDNYAVFKLRRNEFYYKEIRLFETPTDEWLNNFNDKCVTNFNIRTGE